MTPVEIFRPIALTVLFVVAGLLLIRGRQEGERGIDGIRHRRFLYRVGAILLLLLAVQQLLAS